MIMAYVIVGLFGLAFGSFLNVCIARLPRHESIVSPGSHCPRCAHPIRWYDNVPLLSYALLGGRCRDCRARISPVYPIVELVTAGVLLADFYEYSLSPAFVKWAFFSLLIILLIFTDLLERRIPHAVTGLGIASGLAFSFVVPVDNRPAGWLLAHWGVFPGATMNSVIGAAAGALAGGGLFYVVGEVFYRLRHVEGLGFGDVMLMLMAGVFMGAPMTLLTIMLGSFLGTLIAAPLHLATTRFRNYAWPFGTFLGVAAIFSSLGGQALIAAYLRWSGIS